MHIFLYLNLFSFLIPYYFFLGFFLLFFLSLISLFFPFLSYSLPTLFTLFFAFMYNSFSSSHFLLCRLLSLSRSLSPSLIYASINRMIDSRGEEKKAINDQTQSKLCTLPLFIYLFIIELYYITRIAILRTAEISCIFSIKAISFYQLISFLLRFRFHYDLYIN